MSHPKLSVLIPAAGTSERLGQAKQLVSYRGKPLLQNTVNTASSIGPGEILVVTGANASKVRESVSHPLVRWIHNADWPGGMGGSIATGAAAIVPDSDGLMVLLCDQWRIEEQDLRNLAETWQSNPDQIVCAHVEGVNMPPVIFPSACLDQLRELDGSQGARSLIKANTDILTMVEIKNAVFDLDTKTQLDKLNK